MVEDAGAEQDELSAGNAVGADALGPVKPCVKAKGNGLGWPHSALAARGASSQDDVGPDLAATERVVSARVRERVRVDARTPCPELIDAVLALDESLEPKASVREEPGVVASIAMQALVCVDIEVKGHASQRHLALEGSGGGHAARERGKQESQEQSDDGDGG